MKFRKPKVHFRNTRIGCIENITLVRITTGRIIERTYLHMGKSLRTSKDKTKKKRAAAGRKENQAHREINMKTKGTKGTREEQTKRKQEEKEYKGATGGRREKKSAVMPSRIRRQTTRDLHSADR